MHKFSSVIAACPVKVRALFLSEPAVWQIPASTIYICAQPASSSCSYFFLHLLVLHICISCFLVSIHSCHFPFIHSFIHLPISSSSLHLSPLPSSFSVLFFLLFWFLWTESPFTFSAFSFLGSLTLSSVSSLHSLQSLFDPYPTSTHCLVPLIGESVCDSLCFSSFVIFSLSVTPLLCWANGQEKQESQGLSLMKKQQSAQTCLNCKFKRSSTNPITTAVPSVFAMYPSIATVCMCVWDLRMLCVCLSDAELIEVIGGAHAEAGRRHKKKKAHSFEPSLCSAHCQKISPLSLSSYTNNTH